MTLTTRNRMTRSTTTRTDTVRGMVNGLGIRFAGFAAASLATSLVPGATPSRGYAGCDPSQHRPECDCQSPRQERTRSPQVASWQPKRAAKPANPN